MKVCYAKFFLGAFSELVVCYLFSWKLLPRRQNYRLGKYATAMMYPMSYIDA